MREIDLNAGTAFLGRNAVWFDELDSTNAWCRENSPAHGTAVIAGCQTAGRGRSGRGWEAAPGSSLLLSLALRGWPVGRLGALPLVCGLGVCRALCALCGSGFSLKWSNDILFGAKKVCGILCESVLRGQSASAVMGIGVNLTQTAREFESLGLVYAASLESATGKKIENFALAAEICRQMEPLLLELLRNGYSSLREEYKRRCITLGKEVRVITDGHERIGFARDIGGDGCLVCEIGGALVNIYAGEASVRGIYGYADDM